ncbi:MAG: hypothetical protein IT383_22935 [Deltaproteobacteria bacterium]|nr:hypothetical protein [Deltaproteobacteria bacterium]
MSRKRQAQRDKRHELARQLGVASAEVDEHRALQENARVCRPLLRVLAHEPSGGMLRRLWARPTSLVLALSLVDSSGARLLGTVATERGELRIDKLTYHRPAHFLLVALGARDGAALVDELTRATLTLDGRPLADPVFASASWEAPRAVRVGGLAAPCTGAAVSVRGVGRVATRVVLPLPHSRATVAIEL